ncbi:MAG: hypothetical protein HN509_17605 [Halobacteriovoraceae bacterium]|jgi:hypothetical protein|nr:hypothetical protein [Halobacteriovoraceae bacterium]MBT5094572.1 hypothetical protein [Halobacteriovoraceae bacterium]
MSEFTIIPPEPHCPWYQAHTSAPPNIDWCEESLCSWIHEPANTWSNLAYLFVAIYLFKLLRNSSSEFRWFSPAMFLMGLFSLIYHASYNFYTQFFDFLGMYIFTLHLFCLNIYRLRKKSNYPLKLYLGLISLFSAITVFGYIYKIKFQVLIIIIAGMIILSEYFCWKIKTTAINYQNYIISLFLIVIAATFSVLDISRTWCDPKNHWLQGHALWHLFSCLSLYFSFLFYRQFEKNE